MRTWTGGLNGRPTCRSRILDIPYGYEFIGKEEEDRARVMQRHDETEANDQRGLGYRPRIVSKMTIIDI